MSNKEGVMMSIIGLLIYVCLSATGLTLIKLGLGKNGSAHVDGAGLSISVSWVLIAGICLYVLSFLTSLLVMKNMNLSIYYPLSAGLIYIIVCILSVCVVKEKISVFQMIGMIIIFLGIIVMNLGINK